MLTCSTPLSLSSSSSSHSSSSMTSRTYRTSLIACKVLQDSDKPKHNQPPLSKTYLPTLPFASLPSNIHQKLRHIMRQPKYILVHLLNLRLRDGDAASLRFDHLPCSSLVSLGAVAVTVWGTVTARGPPLPGYLRTWIRRASVSGILIWGRLGVGYAGLERGRNDFGLGGWRWRLRLAG